MMEQAKRMLALVLTVLLLLSSVSVAASAAESETPAQETVATEPEATEPETTEPEATEPESTKPTLKGTVSAVRSMTADNAAAATVIGPDQTLTAEVPENGYAWFSFTPEEDGFYIFTSEADADTYAELYDRDQNLITENDDGGNNYNFLLVFSATAGETYYLGARMYGSGEGQFPVKLYQSPIAKISPEPVSLVENLGGDRVYGYNPETGAWELFYQYYWWNYISYTVTMKNGDEVFGSGTGFSYNGQWYDIEHNDTQNPGAPWEAGSTYTPTVSLMGVSAQVSVSIEESPVASIAVNPVTLTELIGGGWREDYDEETDTVARYYHYNWANRISYTVTMKNGDEVFGSGTGFSYNGQWYDITYSDNQSVNNPWTAGNTYTGTVTVGRISETVSITVEELPVAIITADPIELTEHMDDGYWGTGYNPNTGENEEYYGYYWWNELSYTITMKNGKTVTGTGASFEYAGQWYSIECSDDQSASTPWVGGGTYTPTISFGGVSAQVSVTVKESPVVSVTAEPVEIPEGAGGGWNNPDTEADEVYYRYDWWRNLSYTVTMKNGDTVTGTGTSFEYAGKWYSIEHFDDQSASTPWAVGNTYNPTVRVLGKKVQVPVTISENDLDTIVIQSVNLTEHYNGTWATGRNPDTGETELYYQYDWKQCMTYTVTLKNDRTVKGNGSSFTYNGYTYDIYCKDDQSVTKQILPGNTYAFQVKLAGIDAEVLVSVNTAMEADGYVYSVLDGGAVIADCTLQDAVLTIPETLGGYPVTGILSLGDALNYAQEIVVPDSVTMTSGNAFACWFGPLKKVTLGSGISSISLSQYFYCWNLEQIDVSPENPWYTSVDGVVYDKAVTEMIVYPAKKKDTHIIPDSVTNIDTLFHNPEYSLDGNVPSIYEGVSVQTGAGLTDYVTLDGVVYSADMTTIYTCVRETSGTYVMPDTVTEVYRFAFSNSSLEDVTYSPNVTEIVYGAFCYNTSLKTIRIPGNVKSIGELAFDSSYGLESVYIEDLTAWCTMNFDSNPLRFAGDLYVKDELVTDLQIPEGITAIPDYAFIGCSAKSLTMPDSVTAIGWRAFANAGMETAELSQNLQSIDYNAFKGTKLKSVTLPDSLKNLGGAAFADCKDLQSVHIGSGLTEIPYRAFENTGLKSVVIPENILEIGNDAFAYASLQEVVFENDRVRIDDCAFYRCPLKELNLPKAMTAVGWNVFAGNKAVTLNLPDSVTEIQYRSFAFSENLLSVVLPENLQYIDFCAFEDCGKLSHVLYKGTAEQWNTLGVESYILNDAALHCQAAGNEIAVVDTCARIWHYCYICSQWEYIEKLDSGHTMEDGICTVCGYTEGAQETEPTVPEMKPVEPTEPETTEPEPTEPETVDPATCEHCYGEWVITKAPTFTASGRQQKTCSICGNTVTQVIMPAVAAVEKWNISLVDDLQVNFHLLISESIESTAKVKISLGDETITYNVKDLQKTEEGLYVASVELAAAQMADDIVLFIMDKNQVGCYANYTVRQYADTVLADESLSVYHKLVREMLNYGAAAQNYFGYGTDIPANEGITGAGEAEVPEAANEPMEITGAAEGVSFYAASLSYRERIAVRFYFNFTGDINACTFTVNGEELSPGLKNGLYYVDVPGITPDKLDQQIELTVTDADGSSLIVSYSPMNYIVRMNVKGSESLKALLKALYNYHLAAKELKSV